jgi:glycosyltransferase involved in cell wall biosynthesis
VASRAGGIPEIVHHNKTGRLVGDHSLQQELQAAVRLLLEAAPLRRELAMAGRKFVMESATTAMMVSKTVAVYEQVLDASGQRSKGRQPGVEIPAVQLPGVLGGKA